MAGERDNIELIWSVGQLVHLFEQESSVESFLRDVVELVAKHMRADVCSVYLYDEQEHKLVLRATKGLSESHVGKLALEPGEGITGAALKELRPIIADRGESDPNFKYIPALGEEAFQAFLAVPIRQGLSRIGVLVLQHQKAGFFSGKDSRALQVIASQLAATLENVEILMELRKAPRETGPGERGPLVFFRGEQSCGGIGVGRLLVFGTPQQGMAEALSRPESTGSSPAGTRGVDEFKQAVELTREQLEQLQYTLDERLSDVASLIFSTHLLMLMDVEFTGRMQSAIEDGQPASAAVVSVVNEYVDLFSKTSNPRVQEKAVDVKDLGHRILANLTSTDGNEVTADYSGLVVVARSLFPSELVKLAAQNVEGVILAAAGATAHISILARSLEIPTVLTRDERAFDMDDGAPVILDGLAGTVFVNPEAAMLAEFRDRKHRLLEQTDDDAPEGAKTRDGIEIDVAANVNLYHDTRLARQSKATGIGLYRSEFPFIIRNAFPSEEEQYAIYRRIVEAFDGKPVVLRTLDIGGDKQLQYLDPVTESNPFLGFRGIRFSLAHPDLFREQLRAMLRAGSNANLHILFPMISSVDEFLDARDLVRSCVRELLEEGLETQKNPRLGAMIELPSAVEAVEELVAVADFLSIGTNDLVMYMIGVDRTNERVMEMYRPHHPAVLRALARIIRAADRAQKPVSVCGDAASDSAVLRFLIGAGLRRLSVDPKRIGRTRREVAELSAVELRGLSDRLLAAGSVREVESIFNDAGVTPHSPSKPGIEAGG